MCDDCKNKDICKFVEDANTLPDISVVWRGGGDLKGAITSPLKIERDVKTMGIYINEEYHESCYYTDKLAMLYDLCKIAYERT